MTREQINSEDLNSALQGALSALQDQMATLDMMREPGQGGGMELLLKKHLLLVLKMDGNRNHQRAHLHLDYHRRKHMASYAVDNGELLAGDGSYSNVVQPWIARHRLDLVRVWDSIRGGAADIVVVARLQGSAL